MGWLVKTRGKFLLGLLVEREISHGVVGRERDIS